VVRSPTARSEPLVGGEARILQGGNVISRDAAVTTRSRRYVIHNPSRRERKSCRGCGILDIVPQTHDLSVRERRKRGSVRDFRLAPLPIKSLLPLGGRLRQAASTVDNAPGNQIFKQKRLPRRPQQHHVSTVAAVHCGRGRAPTGSPYPDGQPCGVHVLSGWRPGAPPVSQRGA